MSTSGSVDFSVSAQEIITEALEQLGVLPAGGLPSQEDLNTCLRTLNMMIKSWQTRKLHLFTIQRLYLFLTKNKHEYQLGGTNSDRVTSSYVQTTLSAAATAGASTVTVTDATGIAANDKIGIEVSGNVLEWNTVSSVSGTTITLANTTAADMASGATVFSYTSTANRPLKIYECVVKSKDYVEIPVEIIARRDYIDLSIKTADGRVNQLYPEEHKDYLKVFLWPETDKETDVLVLWCQRPLEDFDATADEADFPQEWFLCLAYNLALWVAPKYGAPSETINLIGRQAERLLWDAESWDSEDDMRIVPDYRSMR